MSTSTSTRPADSPAVAAARGQLRQLRRRHLTQRVLAGLLLAAAGALLLGALASRFPAARGPLAVAGLGVAGWLAYRGWQLRRFDQTALARRLDRHFPPLEDSTGLLMGNAPGLLPSLQRQRVAERLAQLSAAEALRVPWPRFLALTAVLLVAGLGVRYWPQASTPASAAVEVHFPAAPQSAVPAAPRLLSTTVQVQPPAYTRRPAYTAASPSLRCPQGSVVRWTVELSDEAPAPQLLLAGRAPLAFQPVPGQPRRFTAAQRFTATTLYQLRVAGRLSDDYAVEVLPDRGPELRLIEPRPYTLVAAHQRPEVAVRLQLRDDYGLTRARLVVTTAQGQGEGVKFGEVITDLNQFIRNQPTAATATARLRLPALGLTYGDELYVYAEAWDNAGRRARTDAHLVQWEDTAATGDLSDLAMGVNPVPAYFRSQRQIIIDTEKLLAQQRRLPPAELQARANSLGDDQKMLRLRYGKFLGEEYESGLTQAAPPRPPVADDEPAPAKPAAEEHHADDGHDHTGHDHAPVAADAGVATSESLVRSYSHLHDDAETADFLEPQVKTKLRAVLSQMWDAELHLRLGQPARALPFEYRALRLLKEVQHQTRAYVRKSGVDLPPLPEAEKRLSGDVSAAAAPRQREQSTVVPGQPAVRTALALLARYQGGQLPRPADAATLAPAGPALAAAALRQPSAGLTTLRAWRQLNAQVRAAQPPAAGTLTVLEHALNQLLPPPPAAPQRPKVDPLARRYFQELSR
ncbi:hypothetical protein [Hymenobacter sp. B81]|uniref:hypothetical protein n=1 Tax=Hymenobacter sp. B81 TaxID=3344878 RepID=UPI0037DC7491